jgi:hypothetical protein
LAPEPQPPDAEGCDEPVYHKGKVVEVIRKFSDTMVALVLKSRVPRCSANGTR